MDWRDADPDIRGRLAAGAGVIVPVGSVEQHGAHLPVSTDSDLVGAVAAGVGRDDRFVVMPTITTGVSFEHAPMFQVSIRESTLCGLLDDVCDSLHSNGVGHVFVINGHYGNRGALERFARLRGPNPAVHAMSYWRFTESRFDHAGHTETSLMLAVSDGVDMRRARRGLATDGMAEAELRDAKRRAAVCFPEATGNGVWGDPRRATALDGERIMREIVRNLRGECVRRLAGAPNEILI